MTTTMKQALYWAPRVLGIGMAAFVSVFALDVFGQGTTFWETIVALSMHLVPTYIVLVALFVAWRWEPLGAVLFTGLGTFYIVWAWGRFPWITYVFISGPLFLMGALFLLSWVCRNRPQGVRAAG